MDFPWMKNNMRRVQVGLDAWVNPQEFMAMQEELDKTMLAKLGPRMVKVTGFTSSGGLVSHASGFLYTKDADIIVTCNHVRHVTDPQPPHERHDVVLFKARYSDGTDEEVHVLTPPHPLYDIMLLSGQRRATTDLLAAYPAIGDTVYVAGFPPESTSLCFSKGMIGSTSLAAITVDAHTDNGWSGGPVINSVGRLVGIVSSGAGATIKRPEAISAPHMQSFLLEHHAPKLME